MVILQILEKMGKYKTESFNMESEAGETFHKKIDFFISASAEFYFKADEALYENCCLLIKERKDFKCYSGKNSNFYSKEYGTLLYLVKEAISLLLKTEKTEELIIAYAFKFNGCYYVSASGEIYPNVYLSPDGGRGNPNEYDGRWNKDDDRFGSRFEKPEGYEFAVYAKVKNKITYTNGTLTKVKYEKPDGFDHICDSEASWGEKLNSFNQMSIPEYEIDSKTTQIPYTEESAKFFYNVLIGICNLNEKLTSLNDPDILKLAMRSKLSFLDSNN